MVCRHSPPAVTNLHRLGALSQCSLITLWLAQGQASSCAAASSLSLFSPGFSASPSGSLFCHSVSHSLHPLVSLCVSISLSFYHVSPHCALSLCVYSSVPSSLSSPPCVSLYLHHCVRLSLCRLPTRSPPLHPHACFWVSPSSQAHPVPPASAGAGGVRWAYFEDPQGSSATVGLSQGLGAGRRGAMVA